MSQIRQKTSRRRPLPDLSRFEWQCLKLLWERGEASAREIHGDLDHGPGYSTVRTILQRLEDKGAVRKTHRREKAWIYRPAVSRARMIRREVKRFLDAVFDGAAIPLVSHLAEMKALGLEDLQALERILDQGMAASPSDATEAKPGHDKPVSGKKTGPRSAGKPGASS